VTPDRIKLNPATSTVCGSECQPALPFHTMSCSQTTDSCSALRPHGGVHMQTEHCYPFTHVCVKCLSCSDPKYFENCWTSISVARRKLEGLAIPSTHACYRRLELAAHIVARSREKDANVVMQSMIRMWEALRDSVSFMLVQRRGASVGNDPY
jgi:hypothetical protein